MAIKLDFAALAEHSSRFAFRNDVLVHNDVRADNCAWNAQTREVKLVDWNWIQLGDRRVDLAATLVHIHNAGFDVLSKHSSRLDHEALRWLAGFWFKSAVTPIWPGGPEHLRKLQLQAGITAYTLADTLSGEATS
jgi:aminoglycoside phosphotransferase (APT) family kinase protein